MDGTNNKDKQEGIQAESCEDSWLAANHEVGAEYSVCTDNSEKIEAPQQVVRFMVYQCELCGFICQWQQSLLLHKEEGHSTLLCQKCGEVG